MDRCNVLGRVMVVLLGGALVVGCTAIERDNAMQAERTLAASGFQMQFADDASKMAAIQALPQRSLVPQQMDGEARFVYADAEFCKCMYVGSAKAYERYQRLSIRQEISQAKLQAAEANESASMNWGMWGGWGPWW